MDKAINYLESRRLFLSAIDDSILNSNQQNMKICELKLLCESLSQLLLHKAKIDELKEWCSDELDKYSEYQTDIECGLFQAYDNVLQKLEELEG